MHIGETIELTASVTGRISINQFIDMLNAQSIPIDLLTYVSYVFE